MALTEIEAQDYLKLASVVKNLPKHPFFATYDAEADVMYIDFTNPPSSADDSEMTENDVVVRYDRSEEIVGLTILHASKRG